MKSARVLSVRDMPSSRLLFRLVPSEHPTGETGFGLLPTAMTQGLKRSGKNGRTEFYPLELLPTPTVMEDRRKPNGDTARQKKLMSNLNPFSIQELLPTPTAIDSGTGRMNKSQSPNAKERPTIALAAKMGLLPTPMSTDIHHGKRVKELKAAGGDTFHSRANGETRPNGLTDFLDFNGLLPTPRANKVNGLDLNNEALANRDKGNLEEAVAKIVTSCPPTDGATSQLNPLFVEEMMAFPLDWLVSPFLGGGRKP